MDKVRFGIIGIGNIGSAHLRQNHRGEVPRSEITAVCDTDPSKFDYADELYGGNIAKFTDYKEMINSGLVDAVIVATPHYSHIQIGIDVLKANLHLLEEKPIGVYTKAVEELYKEYEKHPNLVFGIDYNQRTNPAYAKIREMVQNGEIGKIKRVIFIVTSWYRTQAYYDTGGWRAKWATEGGGVLINQDPHQLDLLQWICGMPSKVQAFTHEGYYHDIEVEDEVTAYMEFPNGATGVFITTTGEYPGTNRLEIAGTKGRIIFESDGKIRVTKINYDSDDYIYNSNFDRPEMPGISKEDSIIEVEGEGLQHIGIMRDFVNAVLDKTPLLAPGVEGINGLSISNAIMLSAWKHDWVSIPNDGEEFYEYLQKKIKESK